MRVSLTRIIVVSSILYALACGAFFAVLAYLEAGRGIWFGAIWFVLATAAIFAGYLLLIRSRMIIVLDKLSLTVQSIIDGREEAPFSAFEDDLLAKLQAQVRKLSGILRAQKLRYQEEGEEMKSLITDITHQLRTPLANLNMYGGLLADGEARQLETHRARGDQLYR